MRVRAALMAELTPRKAAAVAEAQRVQAARLEEAEKDAAVVASNLRRAHESGLTGTTWSTDELARIDDHAKYIVELSQWHAKAAAISAAANVFSEHYVQNGGGADEASRFLERRGLSGPRSAIVAAGLVPPFTGALGVLRSPGRFQARRDPGYRRVA